MTTGRINQVYTKVTVWHRRHGIHAHKPPATRHNFSDQRRRDEGCQGAAGPGEHPQTTHNQETRTVKTARAHKKQVQDYITEEGKILQIYLKTAPENQNLRAQTAHASEQVATMYLVAARPPHYTKRQPERQRDHQTAGRRESRRHPHIYIRRTRGITPIIFEKNPC